jgi:hypothetical protein
MLPIIIFSGQPLYTNENPECSFDNVTEINMNGGISFNWAFSGSVNASGKIMNLDMQIYCGTFKRFLTTLRCNGNLVATTYYKFITYVQQSYTMDYAGNNVFSGDSGSYANTIKNNFGSANYGIVSTKTGKTVATFTGSSWMNVDVEVFDNNNYKIYHIKRDKYPIPSYIQITKVNNSELPIEYLLVFVGSQSNYNRGNGDGTKQSTSACNALCLASFYLGVIVVALILLFCCFLCYKKM